MRLIAATGSTRQDAAKAAFAEAERIKLTEEAAWHRVEEADAQARVAELEAQIKQQVALNRIVQDCPQQVADKL